MTTNLMTSRGKLLLSNNYEEQGFEIKNVFDSGEIKEIRDFALSWVFRLLSSYSSGSLHGKNIENYHTWFALEKVQHAKMLIARNRHLSSCENKKIFTNKLLDDAVKNFPPNKFTFWDEGLGWSASSLSETDLRRLSSEQKEWGVAKDVISCWIQ